MLALPNQFQPAFLPPTTVDAPGYWFAFAGANLLVRPTQAGVELPMAVSWPFAKLPTVRRLYLGALQGQPCHAAEVDATASAPPGLQFESLRNLWTHLDEELLGIASQALQLIEWDRTHQFCGRCGHPTERRAYERARYCPVCDFSAFPRLSPVIMVRIEREGEILLARAPRFASGVYSVLAGFVEAGETLEQALHREVAEEVNIQVKNLRYFASQSWPFPHSLMIAFTAEYAGGQIQVDGHELLDAGWFTAASLPGLPSPMSMAWRLIQDFASASD
jgi:NAD+ diphosphatase